MTSESAPNRLGRYVLHEVLGNGPAGVVYRAADSDTGAEVALKVVRLRADSEVDSLLRDLQATNDIQAATGLRHPGIVRVARVDAIGEFSTTEMEYVRGMSLRDLLAITGRLLPERAVTIASQMLDALAYAHARLTVHGNLKPSNVLVRSDGLVKLSDFGFRDTCPDPTSIRSSPIHAFAAPEELSSDETADRRSDIWSIGVILFYMLTGRLPFPISDPHDSRAWQRGLKASSAAKLIEYVPDSPPSLQEAIDRALRYEREERFQNAREFLNALLASGLCAGMIDGDDEIDERQEATRSRIDSHLRTLFNAGEETMLPDLARAFSQSNPEWNDSLDLVHYAGLLHPEGPADSPEPHAISLTSDEVDHLEEIETRLKSLLTPGGQETVEPADEPGTMTGRAISKEAFLDGTWADLAAPTPVSEPTPQVTARPRTAPLVNSTDGAELVLIPAGEFIMGSNGFSEDNAPMRTVTLDAFAMYKYPVTVGQYRRYCEETAYPMPHGYWRWEEMDPIVGITWQEARAYCEWSGARLPTEAQWEKAARGMDGRSFPWGEQFDQRSNHRLIPRTAGKTSAVGSYPSGASPYGLMDMVGNVQQWCLDLYDEAYYKTAPDVNPLGPAASAGRRGTKSGLVQKLFNKSIPEPTHEGEQRVVRGSSWKDHHESFAFVFRRESFAPGLRLPWVGFRCVMATANQAERTTP